MAEQELQQDYLQKRLEDRMRLAAIFPLKNNPRELGTLLTDKQLSLFAQATDDEKGGLLSQYPPELQVEILRKYHETKKLDPQPLSTEQNLNLTD